MQAIEDSYNAVVARWRKTRSSGDAARAALSESFRVQFAYNSGRIENQMITYRDTHDVFESGTVRDYTGDLRTLFEIQNLKACLEYLEENLIVAEKEDELSADALISESLVLEVHRLLTQGTYDAKRWKSGERPGEFKKGNYVVGMMDTGCPAEDVPIAVRDLLLELSACTEANALTVGAYFHASFESIHPFADGNGRVGRALLNYLLLAYNHPPIIIYDEDKMAYFAALNAWDCDAYLEPMKDFLRVETIKTWQGKLLGRKHHG